MTERTLTMLHYPQDCAGAILYSTEKAVDVAMEGMQCLGGNGYINGKLFCCVVPSDRMAYPTRDLDYPLGRILRDSRLYTVGAGTQEIRRMLIGREFNEECR